MRIRMLDNQFEGWNKKKKRILDDKLVKDQECARCKKWMECKGKPRGMNCLCFIERH